MYDIDDYRWLVGKEAAPWLDLADQHIDSAHQPATAPIALHTTLRKDLSPRRARLVVEQATLRRRGRRKFSRADTMFFTSRSLEQATDEVLARYKATRYAGKGLVADLCCGLGGDLLALAQHGEARGVDSDPIVAHLAAANLDALATGPSRTEAVCGSVAEWSAAITGPWHIDPDRRAGGRRTTHIEDHHPGQGELEALLQVAPEGAIKLAPATTPPPAWQATAEFEWISRNGECKQLVAWFDGLARQLGRRVATIVDGAVGAPSFRVRSVVAQPDSVQDTPIVARPIGRYLYEPDAAVLAAGLSETLALELGIAPLSSASVYLTGDIALADMAVSGFEVTEVLPFRVRRLKQWLAQRRYGRLEVKKRGVRLDANALQRELAVPGDQQATVLITRVGQRVIAIIAQRLALPASDELPSK